MSARLAIVGFGEAGAAIGAGLAEAGASITAFDAAPAGSPFGARVRARAAAAGIAMAGSVAEAIGDADLILSIVVPAAAREVAAAVAPHLRAGQLFLDLNSVGPATKRALREAIESGDGSFVEGAILAAVPPHRHRVPIALSGPGAQEVRAILEPLGARVEVLGREVGAAAALKMQRSLLVKGIEALLIESIAGAERYGLTERVLASMDESFPGIDWTETARYLTTRTALHGARRARELVEVAASLADIGVEPIMADAVRRRLAWAAQIGLDGVVHGDAVDVAALWQRFATAPADGGPDR
ncbi:NAD(P)-dependent oxidoreductase [soil metagenome]